METSYGSGSNYGIADIYRTNNNNNSEVYRHGGGGTELYRNKSVEYPQKPAVVYRKKSANSGKTIRLYNDRLVRPKTPNQYFCSRTI